MNETEGFIISVCRVSSWLNLCFSVLRALTLFFVFFAFLRTQDGKWYTHPSFPVYCA